jgi:hypothetical protein
MVAERLGVSLTLISETERGKRQIPIRELDRYAKAYGMINEQRDVLWRLRTGGYPPAGPTTPDLEATRGWEAYLQTLPFAAVIIDTSWQVHSVNKPWLALFTPEINPAPENLLEFLLWAPHARQMCINWLDEWITPLIPELRVELQQHPTPELLSICDRIIADPDLSAIWHAQPTLRSARHNDGEVRLLRPPSKGGQIDRVRLLVSSPAHDPSRRLVHLIPADATTLPTTAPGSDRF